MAVDHLLHLRGSPPIEALNKDGTYRALERRILDLAGQLSHPDMSRLTEIERLRLGVALKQLDKSLARWRKACLRPTGGRRYETHPQSRSLR